MTLSDAERAGWSATILENLSRLLSSGIELRYEGKTLFGKCGDWSKAVPVNSASDSEVIECGVRALRIQWEIDNDLP